MRHTIFSEVLTWGKSSIGYPRYEARFRVGKLAWHGTSTLGAAAIRLTSPSSTWPKLPREEAIIRQISPRNLRNRHPGWATALVRHERVDDGI